MGGEEGGVYELASDLVVEAECPCPVAGGLLDGLRIGWATRVTDGGATVVRRLDGEAMPDSVVEQNVFCGVRGGGAVVPG